MVVVDKLTKSAHFIPIKSTFNVPVVARVFLQEVIRLHGVPRKIISDRDPWFTLRFWRSLQIPYFYDLQEEQKLDQNGPDSVEGS